MIVRISGYRELHLVKFRIAKKNRTADTTVMGAVSSLTINLMVPLASSSLTCVSRSTMLTILPVRRAWKEPGESEAIVTSSYRALALSSGFCREAVVEEEEHFDDSSDRKNEDMD